MNVFMCTDLEGVAGVVSFTTQTYPDGKYFEQAKRLLTGEINAAVEGFTQEGSQDVVVWDGHGAGGIVYEELHAKARLIHGRPLVPWTFLAEVVRGCDVAVLVGQHAMAGVRDGDLNHTQNSRAIDFYKLNGRPIGELAQFALWAGALGLPTIFLSGDHAACREAQELIPGITTVAVKQGLGRNSAVSLSAVESRRRIAEGASQAIRRQKQTPLPPLVWKGPFVLEKRYFHTDVADSAADRPGAERVDGQTVRYRADNILDIIYR